MRAMYLLDTNVISELVRPRPNTDAVHMIMKNQGVSAIAAVVWGECLYGVKRLPESERKYALSDFYLNTVREFYPIVPFDGHAAAIYSDIRSRLERSGHPAPELDMQIAATAIANNLVLVTRNTVDFENIRGVSALMVENWFSSRAT